MNKKNILILGANGMAGHTISLYLLENGFSVDTMTRKSFHIGENYISNYTDFKDIEVLFYQNKYDVIINCIGILNQKAEDYKYSAVKFNSLLPHFLTDLTQNTSCKIIHLSTDCVFSGKKGAYKETDIKDGDTFYDQTKALGEIIDSKNLTFRNSIIGPDLSADGIGLFNWFMKQEGAINGYTKAIWNGVTTLTLAKAIKRAIEEDIVGLYHLASEPINKYELLNIINDLFKSSMLNINKEDSLEINKTLENTRDDFNFVVPSHKRMIGEMFEWVQSHKELYPHYIK